MNCMVHICVFESGSNDSTFHIMLPYIEAQPKFCSIKQDARFEPAKGIACKEILIHPCNTLYCTMYIMNHNSGS